MQISRRIFVNGLAAAAAVAALAACGGGGGSISNAPDKTWAAVPNAGYDAWLQGFRGRAAARGINASVLDPALASAGYLPGVIERDRNQTEFKRTLEDYLAIAASPERVSDGKKELNRYNNVLSQIEARYGVDKEVVTAIWGVESRYGTRRGSAPVISALSTLAYDGRRGEFFESQLMGALKILQTGDTTPAKMKGSWAGAMGHTQFIPTSYLAYAVDFTGDGRRDIWDADPTDALASAANYLAKAGWRTGQPWGVEVVLPAGFDTSVAGRGRNRSVASWNAMGVRKATGGQVPDYGSASLLIPEGPSGPAFVVFRNFEVLARYNNAVNYVIGVGRLSDRLGGAGPLVGSFPDDEYGLSIEDRKALQAGLNAKGFDAGTPDGVIGSKTISAIEDYQRANGLAVTGQPSVTLVRALG
ncbi:lytic murein transglycosylase [Chachezhania antarctica]|uniref:lytic murein transglycosylase n=1 Tax=Chachezhania antarctica TaxID=2340860 RepID=UPI000EB47A55|nr:lytic murein transglycosylase [Chachezhania antarctica]|tara:strand:- start:1079 stop:2326 length:1248 start_codon:yes stop_codon:yes gene_type:complete